MSTRNFLDQRYDSDEEDDDFDASNSGIRENGGNDPKSDAEDDEETGDDDEVTPRKRRSAIPDDEDEDEDDEEDEDADDVQGRYRKRPKLQKRNQFLDVEAEVDEDDEEVEDDEDELGGDDGFITGRADDDADIGQDFDERRHRELDRQRQQQGELDAENIAKAFRDRYRGRRERAKEDTAFLSKRLMLPTSSDPSIWGITCKPGKEKECVFSVLRRMEENRGYFPVISAFERGLSMAGYIYVESRNVNGLSLALSGINNLYAGKTTLIPISEMPSLLRVRKSAELQEGAYVRLKRGKYQGDLAVVEAVFENGLEVQLRILPRLDYGQSEDPNAPITFNADGKRKRQAPKNFTIANRPAARLFSEAEAKRYQGGRFLSVAPSSGTGGRVWNFQSEQYRDGFLIKEFKISALMTEDVNPTLEEVTSLSEDQQGLNNLDLAALANSMKATSVSNYVSGDEVEIYEGEQQGVIGIIASVVGDLVTLEVKEGALRGQRLETPIKSLRKKFNVGDHVRVVGNSRFRGDVGFVTSIHEDRVTISNDVNLLEPRTVFSKDLRRDDDSGGQSSISGYELHDLVQLDPATVGCIVKVDREYVEVVDQTGEKRSVLPSQLAGKINNRRPPVATDRNGSEIRVGDTVKELTGDLRQGVIKHLHRSYAFLMNRDLAINPGVFVVRTTNLATVAAKGGRITNSTAPDFSKMNPSMQRNGANGMMPPPPKVGGRDKSLGQTVTIRRGANKGLIGIVKDVTDTYARVELHTKNKIIQVNKADLGFKDPFENKLVSYNDFIMPRRYGDRTPMGSNNRTPGWSGNRTPMVGGDFSGGRTPLGSGSGVSGSRTPAWSAGDSGRDDQGYAGGRTPAWQGGGRTPAAPDGSRTVRNTEKSTSWAPGSRTPYGASGDRGSVWDAGSRTPAHPASHEPSWDEPDSYTRSASGGSRTPYASNYGAAPTPGASNDYNAPYGAAPTPGASGYSSMTAPTPGPMVAPTPGPIAAPTPRASAMNPPYNTSNAAPTPWADAAPTPGPISAPTPSSTGAPGSSSYGSRDSRYGGQGRYESAPTPGGYRAAPTPGAAATPWTSADQDDDGDVRYASRSPSPA